MKIIENSTIKIVITDGTHLNHKSTCNGDISCVACGRIICSRCRSKAYAEHTCLICSGAYSPNEILLFND